MKAFNTAACCEPHFVTECLVDPGLVSRDRNAIGNDEDSVDPLASKDDANEIVGNVVSICNDPGGQRIADQLMDQDVVMARELVWAAVAEVRDKACAVFCRALQDLPRSKVVTHGEERGIILPNVGNQLERALDFGGEGEDHELSAGPILELAEFLCIRPPHFCG